MSYKPNQEQMYDEDEELGIDYLESSFESPEVESEEIEEVVSPIARKETSSNQSSEIPQRKASPEVIKRYAPMGVSSIIFNMVDGSSYELVINKRG